MKESVYLPVSQGGRPTNLTATVARRAPGSGTEIDGHARERFLAPRIVALELAHRGSDTVNAAASPVSRRFLWTRKCTVRAIR
jgi:hypothetical protein